MADIKDLQKIDLEVLPASLKKEIAELLDHYKQDPDKDQFNIIEKSNIEKLVEFAQKVAGRGDKKKRKYTRRNENQARSESNQNSNDEEKDKDDQGKGNIKKEKSKQVMEQVLSNIEECRRVIRDYNKKKREAEGTANQPKKKNRTTKLKEKLLAIATLIPEALRSNKDVRDDTKKILLVALADLKKTWKLNVIKQAQDAIKEKFDQMDSQQEMKKAA